MKLGMIGVGYVGLVTGAGFAEMGNDVICMDIDAKKIENLNNGIIPIYEPGLETLVKNNVAENRLFFTTDIQKTVDESDILFIAVGTPQGEDGSADLQYVLNTAENISRAMKSYKIIVTKSTVPVGTTFKVKELIQKVLKEQNSDIDFDVVNNPEFLKEGAAIEDFMKPDRIIIGVENDRSRAVMEKLYHPFVRTNHRYYFMDIKSSEMTKYAANAMLATKISFMNEIARLCEKVGADVTQVRFGIGSDKRIGFHFIFPGLGYGGSCFPKDVQALLRTGKINGEEMHVLTAIEAVNKSQRTHYTNQILNYFNNNLSGLQFAIWGLSFKPGTDDMREAPSITIINTLLEQNAKIVAYDPVATKEAKHIFGDHPNIQYASHPYDAVAGCDALCLLTEWKKFREPNFEKIKSLMKNPVIFDGRNQYDPVEMREMGFYYYSVGRTCYLQ